MNQITAAPEKPASLPRFQRIIDFGDHQLSFEKPVWFSEDIIIRKGYDLLNAFKPVADITNAENWNEGIELKCNRIIEIL